MELGRLARLIQTAALELAGRVVPIVEDIGRWLDRPEARSGFTTCAARFRVWGEQVEAIESPGYVPYFERLGDGSFTARFRAGVIRHSANRLLEARNSRRELLKAVFNLAKRRRWHPAVIEQAERLRRHYPADRVLRSAFERAGCMELEDRFAAAIEPASEGERLSGIQLIEISTRICPYLPSARAPSPDAGADDARDVSLHEL